jgi:hypothetical protein
MLMMVVSTLVPVVTREIGRVLVCVLEQGLGSVSGGAGWRACWQGII